MNILFGIFVFLIVLAIAVVLGWNFYKLGKLIKVKYPISYRIYIITWVVVGSLFVTGLLGGIKSIIDDRERKLRFLKLEQIVHTSGISRKDTILKIEKAKEENLNDKQIYELMLESDRYSKTFDTAYSEGFTDQEIASYFDLYVDKGYNRP